MKPKVAFYWCASGAGLPTCPPDSGSGEEIA